MKSIGCVEIFALAAIATGLAGAADARTAPHASRPAAVHAFTSHRGSAYFSHGRLPGWGYGNSVHGTAWQTYSRPRTRGYASRYIRHHGFSSGGGIQCVTFARADSGIELSGNANTWWNNAAGLYARGTAPEPGSVLNFRANGVMRMGHVAVVQEVVNGRTLVIDHANWAGPGAGRGRVSRNISVVDVSPGNDWSAVRVALGQSGDYGSIYPTYGFIYNRPDSGRLIASAERPAAMPALNPAPRDLRPREQYDEVAEAPEMAIPGYSRHGLRHHHAAVLTHRRTRRGL